MEPPQVTCTLPLNFWLILSSLGWIMGFTLKCTNSLKNLSAACSGHIQPPLKFLCNFDHFWVNRAIHPKCVQIPSNLVYESFKAWRTLLWSQNSILSFTVLVASESHFWSKPLRMTSNFLWEMYRPCVTLLWSQNWIWVSEVAFGVNRAIHPNQPYFCSGAICALPVTCVFPVCDYFQF